MIDIELSEDLVALPTETFDLLHGDANLLDELCAITGCDLVHGSFSLENLVRPPNAPRCLWRRICLRRDMVLVALEEGNFA